MKTAKGLSVSALLKMAAYHQYYAVNAAVLSTIRASAVNADSPLPKWHCASRDVTVKILLMRKTGDRKAGVVWHTQGSGKSLSMVFYTGKIVLALDNPTVVVITDRNDLDDQLFGTFSSATQLLRQTPKQADNREELKEYLRVASGGVVFTTIQKFQPNDGSNIYELLSDRTNIVVIADEAHRSQYGFSAKEVDVKDSEGNVTGKRTVYGFAKYMRDALPNATYLGFTGTPIEKRTSTRLLFLVTMLISTISRRPLKMVQQFVSFMKAVLPKLPSVMKVVSLLKTLMMSLTRTN